MINDKFVAFMGVRLFGYCLDRGKTALLPGAIVRIAFSHSMASIIVKLISFFVAIIAASDNNLNTWNIILIGFRFILFVVVVAVAVISLLGRLYRSATKGLMRTIGQLKNMPVEQDFNYVCCTVRFVEPRVLGS